MRKRLIPASAKLLSYNKKTKEMPGFSTAYEYRPKEFVEHEHGYFYVVLEIAGTDEGAEDIANLIIGTAKEEYYSDLTREPLTSFESALQKINEELADATEEGKISWLGKLSAVICVLTGRDLHVTRTGAAEAHLLREGKFTHITEELTIGKNEEPHPLKTFVNIASGTVEEGDKILLLTPGIYHYLSKEEIERYADEYPPQKAIAKLAELLNKEENDIINSLILFEVATPETISEEALPEEPEEVWVGEPKGAIESSLEETTPIVKKTAHKTKGVLGSVSKFVKVGVLPALSSAATGVGGAVKKLKKKKEPKVSIEEETESQELETKDTNEEKEEPKVKAVAEAMDMELEDYEPSSLQEEEEKESEEIKIGSETEKESSDEEIKEIPEEKLEENEEMSPEESEESKEESEEKKDTKEQIEDIEDTKELKEEPPEEFKEEEVPETPKRHRKPLGSFLAPVLNKFKGTTPSTRRSGKKTWIKILIPVLIVGIIVFGIYYSLNQQQKAKLQRYESIYTEAQSKERDGENQLTSGNKTEASKLLNEALTILDQLKGTNYKESEIAGLVKLINSKIDEAENIVRITSEADFDLGSISGSAPKSLFLINGVLYSIDINNNSIYKIDISKKEIKTAIDSPTQDEKFKSATYDSENDLMIFLTDKSVWTFNPEDSTANEAQITPSGEWEKGSQIASYASNLYILDPDTSQIKKHLPTSGGYSRSTDYLKSEVNLNGAISLAIDTNIYILKSDGTIIKFFTGEKKDFSITGLPTSLKDPSFIYTTPDLEKIYILDNGGKRVVVLDKEGRFIKQYVSDNFSDLSGITFDPLNKVLYVLSSTKIYKIAD